MNAPTNLVNLCYRFRVTPPNGGAQNPSLEAVIQAFEQQIRQHHRSPAASASSSSGDHFEWKQWLDALHDQLQQLRDLQAPIAVPNFIATTPPEKITPSKWAKSEQPPELEPVPDGPTSGPNVGQPGPDPGQPTPVPLERRAPRVVSPSTNEPASSASTFPADLNVDLCEDALDLLASPQSKSPLDTLPDHQRHAISQLLKGHSARDVAKLLIQPPPIGLNLKIGRSSLLRFKERYRKEQNQKDQLLNVDLIATAYSGDSKSLDRSQQILIERLITARLGKRAADPNSSSREIANLVRALNSLRRQTLTEKKVHLELCEKLGWGEPAERHESQSLPPQPTV